MLLIAIYLLFTVIFIILYNYNNIYYAFYNYSESYQSRNKRDKAAIIINAIIILWDEIDLDILCSNWLLPYNIMK